MSRAERRASQERGFTLLEMLIVLAIVVMVAGAIWPAFRAAMDKAELIDAAKGVRTALSQARLDAIDGGAPRQFRYQPGGTQYEVSVYSLATDSLLTDAAEAPPPDTTQPFELASGLRFATPVAPDTGEPVEMVDEWAPPILLYPNGRSDNLRLRILGAERMSIEVSLRGVAGVAKVGPVERREEDEP